MTKQNKKWMWFGIMVLFIIGMFAFLNHQAGATGCNSNNPDNCPLPSPICDNGEHTGNPHCHPTVTPTITPICDDWGCVSPSVSPVISSTSTPTPTVSLTPTVTSVEPTNTPGPGNVPDGGKTDTTEAPGAATCNIPFSPPVLQTIVAGQSGQLTLNWLESANIDKFSITYGFVGQPLNMGVDNIPSNSRSFTIGALPVGAFINAQVQAWQGGCDEVSNILDPRVR